MRRRANTFLAMCACGGVSLLCASVAHADMVLGWEETVAGITGQGTGNVLPVSGSAFYGRTFTTPTTVIPGSDAPGYGFYDDFLFWIGPANVDSATVSLNLSNLGPEMGEEPQRGLLGSPDGDPSTWFTFSAFAAAASSRRSSGERGRWSASLAEPRG